MKTGFDWLVEDARNEGERSGERKKALKIADKLKNEGVDVDTIARATGLTVDEILQR